MVVEEAPKGALLFRTGEGEEDYAHWRSPANKWELQKMLDLLFGLKVAGVPSCPDHDAPLDAVWESYNADHPVVVWKGARGLAGKTTLLAAISLIELLDGADVNILGGSSRQSQRVHEVESESWSRDIRLGDGTVVMSPVQYFIPDKPTSWSTKTRMGNKLYALAASTRAARGPHPQRLRMDEIDEMKPEVYHSAMGQAMGAKQDQGVQLPSQTTLSSTLQYPDGTMRLVLNLAAERGWPVFTWCHRESHVSKGGWLTDDEIQRKKDSVSKSMWLIEYELQEPTAEGRLFTADSLRQMFESRIGRVDDKVGAIYEFEKPRPNASYATGVDWARDLDYTAIITVRYDCYPARIVAYERAQHEQYPQLVHRAERRRDRYQGSGAHDAIGIGAVITDYLSGEWMDVKSREDREKMLGNYVMAVEAGKIQSPVAETIHNEHKYARSIDIQRGSKGHPPDTLYAAALAWSAATGFNPKGKRIPGRIGRPRKLITRQPARRSPGVLTKSI